MKLNKKVLEYTLQHSIPEASKKFGLLPKIILQDKELKKSILKYAMSQSIMAASKKFGVSRSSLYKWLNDLKLTPKQQTKPITAYGGSRKIYPDTFKQKCVDFVKNKPHFPTALVEASKKFDVPSRTLRRWTKHRGK